MDQTPGVVLVWFNQNHQPIHAAYVLTKSYGFNKHGQTMFYYWQILPLGEVLASWNHPDYVLATFRR